MGDAPGALADKAHLPHSRNAVPRIRGSGKVHRRYSLIEEERAVKQSWIKRIFSFVLALVMVLGMVPAGAIHVPHAHAATDPSKYDLVIDFDYQTENNVKTPEQALELVKDESLSDMAQPTLARSVYDGDWDELREWLEDPSDSTQIIQLQEDVTIYFNASRDDYDGTFKITGDKILDLNGYEFQIYDGRNAKQSLLHWAGNPNGDQNTTISSHHAYIFQISQGATLTVIDTGGTKDDPGRIYANATMINHQKWDFLYYTHRDIFHVLDGNVVIYGGEFQAGRQKDQLKSNFSWTKLKNVIGQAVVLGTNILEYTSGISAAEAADLDLKEELFLSKDNKDTEGEDDGKGDKGAAAKKTGEDGTKDTKKDTPASAGAQGDKSQQAEQTVAQKQNGKNNGTQDGASKGDQSGENKENKDKPAKEEGKWTQLAKSEKAIASAKWDKDKIGNVVNSAFDLAEGIAGLLGTDERSRATACIQGTVAKVSNGGTLVIYDGYFIGHGSTPNVRNAVIEVETSNVKNTNPQSLHYGKNTGGYVYVYGGTFDAMTGANVFNMVVTKTNQKQFTYTKDSSGNIVATEVTLPKHETQNMQVLRYDPASLAEWQAGYNAIPADDTAALEAYPNPELVNTANVVVRGGTFRCYYEPIIMSVLENKKEGSWCPDCQKYDDSCDGIDHHIFNGTAGAVNLGVESFDQDLIKDGRIQIVDVYGQGKLVLLDGGEPIYPDGEPASGNNDSYQTEGGFRQYRLFCGDTELRASSYLMVYPNDAKTNSSNSMALRTYWGTGDDLSDMWDSATPKEEKEWPADMDNIRAPYSSNEKYIEFVYDDYEDDGDGISANYYVIPNLKNTDPKGSNLNSSNVWYYNVPVDADEEPIVPKVRYFDYDALLSGQIVTQDVEYATNIKWFNYKVYRVDPLSRENISENGIPCENDDNPLIEVCYGASPDSLKCKLPLLYLEEQIKARVPGWDGYDSGEMYRIVFSVEEHLAYGFNTASEFDNTMTPASAESSILFLCVSKDELKKETYTNPNTGKEATHYVPDWTPLHFTTDKLMAGETATVNLIEGQTGLVDWVGDKVFDVYYQWWEVDENGNDIRLLAGTDNIWVAQDTVGKNNHRPNNWIIGEDGNGTNGELYANTVDPDSAAATQYTCFPNGLPKNTANPEKSGALWSHEMLHMYTLETTGQNVGLKARPNESLNMGNNNAFWGNTDSCYIPMDMVGKYIQVRVIAVNCQYPTYYDNKQTYESHVMKVDGVRRDFNELYPAVSEEDRADGVTELGTISVVPTFYFTFDKLTASEKNRGYSLTAEIIHKIDGVENKVVNCVTDVPLKVVKYNPRGVGDHEIIYKLQITKNGRVIQERTHTYTFSTDLAASDIRFTGFGPYTITDEEWDNRYVHLGVVEDDKLYVTSELPSWAMGSNSNYTWESAGEVWLNGQQLPDPDQDLFDILVETDSETQIRTSTISYTPSYSGDYKVLFYLTCHDASGNLIGEDEFTAEFTVVADEPERLRITSDTELVTMSVNETAQVPVEVWPRTANQKLICTSSNPDVVSVSSDGVLTAKRAGSAVIYVQDAAYVDATAIYVTVEGSGILAYVGGVGLLNGQYLAVGATKPTVTKPADNYAYAYRENGVIYLELHNYSYEGFGFAAMEEDAYGDEHVYGNGVYFPSKATLLLYGDNQLSEGDSTTFVGSNRIYLNGGNGVRFADGGNIQSTVLLGSSLSIDSTWGILIDSNSDFYIYYCDITIDSMRGIEFRTEDQGRLIFDDDSTRVTINSSDNAINADNGTIMFNGGRFRLVSTESNALETNALLSFGSGIVYAEGALNAVLATGTSEVRFNEDAGVQLRSMNTENDSEYCALKVESGYCTDLAEFNDAAFATNNSGWDYEDEPATDVSAYDFIALNPYVSGMSVSIYPLYLFDGCMYYADADSTVEATGSVPGTIMYKDGVLTLNNFQDTCGIDLEDEEHTEINLIGNNGIESFGMYLASAEFTGDGDLDVIGTDSSAINFGDLVFSGTGRIYMEGPEEGLHLPESITVNSGTVEVYCESGYALRGTYLDPLLGEVGTPVVVNGGSLLLKSGNLAMVCYDLPNWGMDIYATNDPDEAFGEDNLNDAWSELVEYKRVYMVAHEHKKITYVDYVREDCFTDGCLPYYKCSCGAIFTDAEATDRVYDMEQLVVPKLEHKWQKATCDSPEICAYCWTTHGEPLDHSWVAASCAEPMHCKNCGETVGEALEHTLGEGVVTKAPTCCEDGVLTYTCSVCGGTETEAIPADPNAHKFDIAATCDDPVKCSLCGVYSGYALGHQWEAATCTAPKTCSVCHATEGSALGHNWADATCTSPKRCASCGITEGSELGHSWIDATCTEPKTCDRCTLTEGAPLGHTWDVSDCTQARTCTVCGETAEAGVHTLTTDDLRHQGTCEVCGMTIASELHTFGDDDFCDVCGKEVKLIDEVNVTVPIPVGGNTAVLTASGDDDEKYTVTPVYWYTYVDGTYPKLTETDTFQCGQQYALRVSVDAADGYRVDRTVTVATYNGTRITGFNGYTTKNLTYSKLMTAVHPGLTHVPAVEATCTTDGNVAYYHCDTCNKNYTTETGNTEITDVVTPALGHNMVDGTCTRCGYSEAVGGPQIVSQPVDYVGMVGDNATFTVVAEGEGLKYQWYFYDANLSSWQKSPGNTSATMSVEFKAYRNNQEYRCEITDSDGNTITTNVVKIVAQVVDLVIVTQPVDYVGSVNDNVSFTVEATGNGLTYQWYYSDNGGTTWVKSGTPGFATNNLLPILRTYRDGFVYYCQITDIFGNTVNSDVVSMTVKASEIVITKKPEDVNGAKLGELYYFESEATGDNLEFRWEFSKDGGETWELSWNQGYNTPTLGVRMNANRDGYLYRCKIVSGLKTVVYTDPVSLNLQAPSAQIVTQPTNVATIVNKTIKFQVQATGTDLTYKWYRSNDKGATWIETFLAGYNTDTLSFVATNARAAMYMCKITDGSGKAIWSSPVKLQILSAELKILTQPESIICASGATAAFTVEAQGDGLKYQWYASSDGGATWAASYLGGYNTDTFSFVVNASRAAKLYKCVITDAGGNVVETNYVSVTIG